MRKGAQAAVRTSWRTARRNQAGFTLAELLIAVSILGIISGAIAAAFVTTAHDSIGVAARLSESHDAQTASAFLATDVQSNAALTSSICGTGGTPLINFGYSDGTIATYAYGASGGETRLTRRQCGATASSSVVLVHNGGGTPTLACDGAACNPATAPRPNKVTITIPELNNVSHTNDYTYTLSGSRRAFVTSGGPTPPPPAPYGILALGPGSGALTIGGNGTVNVTGPVLVNSASAGAVSNSANGKGGDGLHATGTFSILQGGTCTGCGSGNTSPWPNTTYSQSIPDPFAGLPIPDEAGRPVYSADNAYHGPGVYTKMLNITGGNVALADGIYILEAGMSISGGSTVVSGNNVLLFNGCGLHPQPGCSNTGTLSQSGQAQLNIVPAQTGNYALLVIWQPKANTQPLTLSGGSQASLLQGIVYAPGSTGLTIGTGGAALRIWSVVGTKITVQGSGTINVGQS
jgi:prepilin-type N-terminal cleavage/methylation domain-containing protein